MGRHDGVSDVLSHARALLTALAAFVATAGCADPYSRYGAAVHDDVDAAMASAFQMTARLQLTVVRNIIPFDSLAAVVSTITKTARGVRERATHFGRLTPPPDLQLAHARLSAQLSRLAEALDAMGSSFQRCADEYAAGDSTGRGCHAHLADLNSRFGFVGEDLRATRNRVQKALWPHGVMLRPITLNGSTSGRTG